MQYLNNQLFSDARFYLDFLPKTMQPFGFSFGGSHLNSTSLGLKSSWVLHGVAMFCFYSKENLSKGRWFAPTHVATLIPLVIDPKGTQDVGKKTTGKSGSILNHQAAMEGKFGKPSFKLIKFSSFGVFFATFYTWESDYRK